jgi:hypothetical protein
LAVRTADLAQFNRALAVGFVLRHDFARSVTGLFGAAVRDFTPRWR